jgi:hypothetical protein
MTTRDADIVKEISSYVNSYSSNYKEFARLMSYEHRTLQQEFTQLCIEWLKKLSKAEGYDIRNEASVKFAQSIKNKLDKVNLPLI